MTDLAQRALLPAGLRDILPPLAAHEAATVTRLMGEFAARGYERVKPPLIEFETSLSSGADAFRVMDPLTQQMMAVRSDMTAQVARIAATRLKGEARPLRLAYAGQVLRVKGTQLRADRQFGQVGIELFGAPEPSAEAEILTLCVEALAAVGLTDISVDLTISTLAPLVVGGHEDEAKLRDALDHKDATTVAAAGTATAKLLTSLIEAVGPAERGLARLAALDLPAPAARKRDSLLQVASLIRAALPGLTLTIDPVENRGLDYSGVGFTIFSRRSAGEIGRGGRYLAHGEPAVGATLFMDTLLEVLPNGHPERRIYLPVGIAHTVASKLRKEGWITINGLSAAADDAAEAKRLRCTHWLAPSGPRTLPE